MKPKVLIDCRQWVDPADWARLAEVVEPVRPAAEQPYTEEQFIAALQGCAGVIRMGELFPELTRRVLEGAPQLRLAGVRGDRFGKGIDLVAAAERGIRAVDTDNIASSQPVAEWDLAMMILCLRNTGVVFRQMMAGTEKWAHTHNEEGVNGELTGKQVGLVGCGHVGQRLIELLAPFRVDLKVYDPYLPEEVAARLGIVRGALDEVIRHAEILVVQVPHTPRTEKMIGARELALLRQGGILVNCSRGKVLDQEALIKRLEAGDLVAGLDVFDPEPLPADHVLRRLPNVFATPHIAWCAPHAYPRYFGSMAEEFARFFSGQPLRYELTQRMVDIRNGRM
jgi:phosphoglycerate dehydrogenase-like enzyme